VSDYLKRLEVYTSENGQRVTLVYHADEERTNKGYPRVYRLTTVRREVEEEVKGDGD
jgi:hypothetical protein